MQAVNASCFCILCPFNSMIMTRCILLFSLIFFIIDPSQASNIPLCLNKEIALKSSVCSHPPEGPEAAIRSLYDLVTFSAGTTPDWGKVRNLFIPEAVIVLRSSRTAQSIFSVDGFVQDFVNFIERAEVIKTGFEEKIVSIKLTEFGDIAHAFVVYEARIPDKMPRPQTGVDSFQLIRQDGIWKIASIVNELPGPDRPLPEGIRN